MFSFFLKKDVVCWLGRKMGFGMGRRIIDTLKCVFTNIL